MKKCSRIWLVATAMALPALAWGHDGHDHDHEPIPAKPAEVYKPSAVPDRILLSWQGDPRTSQSVTWRTDDSVKRAFAEIALSDHGPLFEKNAKRIDAVTTPLQSDLGLAHYHTGRFDELVPDTKYLYRVGDGVNWSEWSQFQTASNEPKPFTFVYFGDAQNNLKSHWSRVVRQAFVDAPRSAFMLHAGDLVNRGSSDAEWGEWFYTSAFIHRMIPCIATPGNHEYVKQTDAAGKEFRDVTTHWAPTFALPENGPAGLEETAYFLDYQGCRIVSLNSNRDYDLQASWLETVLANNPNPWTIIAFHHPIYSSKAGRDNVELRKSWQPVFDKFKVDLVLQGHDHTYARSQLMAFEENVPTGVVKHNEKAGTVYVVSVSGPKMYDLGRRPFMKRAAEDTQLFQIITVDGSQLRYEARTARGDLYDAFTLDKAEGKVNQLTEHPPTIPERRRPKKTEEKATGE